MRRGVPQTLSRRAKTLQAAPETPQRRPQTAPVWRKSASKTPPQTHPRRYSKKPTQRIKMRVRRPKTPQERKIVNLGCRCWKGFGAEAVTRTAMRVITDGDHPPLRHAVAYPQQDSKNKPTVPRDATRDPKIPNTRSQTTPDPFYERTCFGDNHLPVS